MKILQKDPKKSLIKIIFYKVFHKLSNAAKVFKTNRIYKRVMIFNSIMNLLRISIRCFWKDLDLRKTGVLIKNN